MAVVPLVLRGETCAVAVDPAELVGTWLLTTIGMAVFSLLLMGVMVLPHPGPLHLLHPFRRGLSITMMMSHPGGRGAGRTVASLHLPRGSGRPGWSASPVSGWASRHGWTARRSRRSPGDSASPVTTTEQSPPDHRPGRASHGRLEPSCTRPTGAPTVTNRRSSSGSRPPQEAHQVIECAADGQNSPQGSLR